MMRQLIRVLSCIFAFLPVLPLRADEQRFVFEGIEMAVPIRIVIYAENEQFARYAADEALETFHDLNIRLSDYDENSEVRRLCDYAFPETYVRVSDDLWRVLQESVRYARLSDGAFDPTVGQTVRLWRHARKSKRLPPRDRLEKTLKTIGYENILFDPENQAVALSRNGAQNNVRIDLGGVAKGYAIDAAMNRLRQLGLTRFLVDAGGDVGLGDPPPGRDGWTIAIQTGRDDAQAEEFLLLSNCGIAHSGDAFQFVEIDGRRYSHIVDPATGLGLTNRAAVSIVAPTACMADALASALCVLPLEKGIQLAESLDGVDARIIQVCDESKENIETRETSNFSRRQISLEALKEMRLNEIQEQNSH